MLVLKHWTMPLSSVSALHSHLFHIPNKFGKFPQASYPGKEASTSQGNRESQDGEHLFMTLICIKTMPLGRNGC